MADGRCEYPTHDSELDALSRIEGQVRGIKGMVEDRRYCVDILIQIRAVHAALRRVERNILESYLETCVQRAFSDGPDEERERKIAEILALFDWENGKPAR
jgi:CsoR family transcriptional regulator, copper-sensing transcriptional repressor